MEITQNSASDNQNKQTILSSFIEFMIVLVKYRLFLLIFIFSITTGATLYALLAPKWYKSTTSVLAAEQSSMLGNLGGLSNLVKNFKPSSGISALTGPSELDRYIAILKSGTMMGDVINKFNLKKSYDLEDKYNEDVVKVFISNLEIEVQDEGNLNLSVYDKNPKKAADIANYMIEKLNEINTQLSVQNARENRIFVEKRYLENIDAIDSLESEMKKFQEKYGVIAVPEQLESTFKAMSELSATLAKKEIELNVIRSTFGENSPLKNQAEIEVSELRNKINNINEGKNATNDGFNILIPFKKAPDLANKYLKIFKDLEIQYKILEFVQPLYEQAKVEEVRNTPSVLVLDYAGIPERKSRPKGSIYLIVSLLMSSFVGIFIVFSLHGISKLKQYSPETYRYFISSFNLRSVKK